jgi:hypothetical protein
MALLKEFLFAPIVLLSRILQELPPLVQPALVENIANKELQHAKTVQLESFQFQPLVVKTVFQDITLSLEQPVAYNVLQDSTVLQMGHHLAQLAQVENTLGTKDLRPA